jgi:hypothetical protein
MLVSPADRCYYLLCYLPIYLFVLRSPLPNLACRGDAATLCLQRLFPSQRVVYRKSTKGRFSPNRIFVASDLVYVELDRGTRIYKTREQNVRGANHVWHAVRETWPRCAVRCVGHGARDARL